MNCAICERDVTQEFVRVLHGKVICAACVGALAGGTTQAEEPVVNPASAPRSEVVPNRVEPCQSPVTPLELIRAELSRLEVAEEGVGPSECITAKEHGDLYELTDDVTSAVAPLEKLLERLRTLPDGAGVQATWWMLADL